MPTMTALDANITSRSSFARRSALCRMRDGSYICRTNVATMSPLSRSKPVVAHPRVLPHRARKLVDPRPASVIACVEVIRIRNRPRAMSMYPIRSGFARDGSDPARLFRPGPAVTEVSDHPLGLAGRSDGGSITVVDRSAAATKSADGLIGYPLTPVRVQINERPREV